MSDGSSSGNNIGEMVSEYVVKPVTDEVGKMVEVGVQSITGSGQTQDPEEAAQKKADEQRKLQNVKSFLAQMTADEQRLRQQRAEEQQKKSQEQQMEQQEQQQKVVEKNQKKAEQNQQILEKQRATEARQGKGVGG